MPGQIGRALTFAPPAVNSAIDLYNYLTAAPRANETIALELESREYGRSDAYPFDFGIVRSLSKEETQIICPRLAEVQNLVDEITAQVRRDFPNGSAQEIGTQIHNRVAVEINSRQDPDFRAEVSFSDEKPFDRYGKIYTIRVDVFERTSSENVCVYDVKTGEAGLTIARSGQLAGKVYRAFKIVPLRIIVTEVRPRR